MFQAMMKSSIPPAPAATAAASRIGVALSHPLVPFALFERMRMRMRLPQLGLRFLETLLAERSFPRQQERLARREPGFDSVDHLSQWSEKAAQPS